MASDFIWYKEQLLEALEEMRANLKLKLLERKRWQGRIRHIERCLFALEECRIQAVRESTMNVS